MWALKNESCNQLLMGRKMTMQACGDMIKVKWKNWPVGLMDKASASGAGDSEFECRTGHMQVGQDTHGGTEMEKKDAQKKVGNLSRGSIEPRRRTNVQQLTCKMDLSNYLYYLFFSFVLLELKKPLF